MRQVLLKCHSCESRNPVMTLLALFLLLIIPAQVYGVSVFTPNDPYYEQYQQSYFEQARIPEAWQIATGSPEVVIAVIDSGVDIDHPDIMGNMWFNPGEIPLNGIDDDNNGYIDDLNGWDFVDNVSDPHPKFSGDFDIVGSQHGTAVAGIAAAITNNNEGVAGVCPGCKIMALRAIDSLGVIPVQQLAKAIDYAVKAGAQIINFSFVSELAGSEVDQIIKEAMAKAYSAGALLVAAAGNNAINDTSLGGDLAAHPLFPVCFDGGPGQNQVLGVGSVDRQNRKSSFSDYGSVCLDINAPGEKITVATAYDPKAGENFTEKYEFRWSGTSLSAPFAAGVAGLVKSANPRLTADQVINIIRQTGKDITTLNSSLASQLGGGLIDAAAAIRKAKEIAGELPEASEPKKEEQLAGKPLLTSEEITVQAPRVKKRQIIITVAGISSAVAQIEAQDGRIKNKWPAFSASFRGGVNIARADVDGDGDEEVIVAPHSRGGPQVRVFSENGELANQFFAYNANWRRGLVVGAADTDNDNRAEIITAAANGRIILVSIFDASGALKHSFRTAAEGSNAGISLAAGSIGGQARIIIAASAGALPKVRIFDTVGNKKAEWLAFGKSFRGGVKVAVGDVDGDGQLEIVATPASKGGPQVRVFTPEGKLKYQFFAFEPTFRTGASIAVGNVDDDPLPEIIVGTGPGVRAAVSVFGKFGADFAQESAFNVFEDKFKGGVNVAI